MKSVRPLCLATLAGLSVLTSCQGEATEESTATGVTETETADTTDPETTAGICNESDIPLGEGYPAPEADCPDTLSDTASDIQQGFVNTGLAGMALRAELLDPNNINVILCGTGTPVPSNRAQACTAVFVAGKFFLFDAGDGASRSAEGLNLPLADLGALFLTHFHSDHIAGVGEIMSRSWILGRDTPLTIYGGQGVERIVTGFNHIYALDDAYREAHHGPTHFPIEFAPGETGLIPNPGAAGQVVYEKDGVRVLAFSVDHSPIEPALGYRVEYMGKVVGISGDTIATEGLTNLARDADVLVSEVMNKAWIEETECALRALPPAARGADIFRDIRNYHIDVAELGQAANDAGVQTLVLTHMVPTPVDAAQADTLFVAPISETFSGTLEVGDDGDRITIPLN